MPTRQSFNKQTYRYRYYFFQKNLTRQTFLQKINMGQKLFLKKCQTRQHVNIFYKKKIDGSEVWKSRKNVMPVNTSTFLANLKIGINNFLKKIRTRQHVNVFDKEMMVQNLKIKTKVKPVNTSTFLTKVKMEIIFKKKSNSSTRQHFLQKK